ncbi:MazG nucleotide pyrophosphohydrolase domain-containing protein [Pseudoclavibacter terrae]|uniref:NTP pyrophosphohydrolase MazG-like domain-containing protein n=1 Tax=Pseudoclavibacter terrae TaxID=1530195 RepID=A0A7J5B611_9MICO|nr:MazG nucleotide pyrophosphohydrolase domain-containing protein [Pseudoclavibacter terrae]KAB1639592.1 hypothetical protein F8O03_04490 [Pseudoclavibacter terrae]
MADAGERSGRREHPELLRLLEVVEAFRGEGGCAWYEEQTHATLVKYLTEETAELVEALEDDDPTDIREELGDVLFQVLFHSDIASTRGSGAFTLEDVAREQADKLVRRNPHVFGPTPTRDIDEIIRLWQEAKAVEKRDRTSVLDGVPRDMSALALAQKLLGKERQVAAAVSPAVAADTASVSTTLDSGWESHLGMGNKPSGSEKAIPKPGVEGVATGDVDSGWESHLGMGNKPSGSEKAIPKPGVEGVATGDVDSGWGNHLGMGNKPSGSEEAIPKPGVEEVAAGDVVSGWENHLGMENKPSGSEKAIPKPGAGQVRSEGGRAGAGPADREESDAELELGRTLLALVRDADARGLDAERAMRLANRELERRIRSAETPPA